MHQSHKAVRSMVEGAVFVAIAEVLGCTKHSRDFSPCQQKNLFANLRTATESILPKGPETALRLTSWVDASLDLIRVMPA